MCLHILRMCSGMLSSDAMLQFAGTNACVVKDNRKENCVCGAFVSGKLLLYMSL